ncbi:helicase-related protein [Streptomyces atroolivaceus]|uniref:helicase-related protein n=1 Tax=Streptomyces atroolivaceus TaxID=66869 RepID=UPI0037AF54B3
MLSCSPTLELGIEISGLSAVVLASLPKGPANYIQRVGRAGRSTGNAYLLTMVDRGPRDRYYLEEPRLMIAGDNFRGEILENYSTRELEYQHRVFPLRCLFDNPWGEIPGQRPGEAIQAAENGVEVSVPIPVKS